METYLFYFFTFGVAFVREYFEPSGSEGWAPTFRRISISKTQNTLTFEDIDE